MIDPVVKIRDFGVTIDCDMKFHSHTIGAVSKANQVAIITY